MATKNFKIEFFTATTFSDDDQTDWNLGSKLDQLHNRGERQPRNMNGHVYEIRDLEKRQSYFKGVFAKLRLDNIPHAGKAGGNERELDLADDEGLLEKNYFLYRPGARLLIWQLNGNASRESRFAKYLSTLFNKTLTFDPILKPEPTRRLLQDELMPKELEISVAAPQTAEAFNLARVEHNFSREILTLMKNAGGSSMKLSINSDSRRRNSNAHHLKRATKRLLLGVFRSGYATRAKMTVEDVDGELHPIDLFADRILTTREVEMNGRYPDSDKMHTALFDAYRECRDELAEILDISRTAD